MRILLFFTLSIIVACQHVDRQLLQLHPQKEVILDGLKHPWSIAFITKDEAFISEKEGDLLRVELQTKTKTIIKGFPTDLFVPLFIEADKYPPLTYPTSLDSTTSWGNAGILDVILHPKYSSNNTVYISYVAERDKTYALKVISAQITDDSLQHIQTILDPGPYVPGLWHFGGGLCISDDKLYVTVGERLFFEGAKQGLPIAQEVTDPRGAIYRLNLDGSIPDDNPSFDGESHAGIFAFGIRAAQGITTRPGTGDLWFSEHGTIQGDEINILKAGANYGWPNVTSGKWRTPGYTPDELASPNYTDPQHYWVQTIAPTGLTFYNGAEFPTWKGNLIVPGLSAGNLWRLTLDGNVIVGAEELFINDRVRSRKAKMSPDGHLYILTDEVDGKLIRITNRN